MQMGSYSQPLPIIQKKHTGLGWASFILGIIALVLIILILVLIFANIGYMYYFLAYIFALVGFIISIIAIVFGALAYFGRHKDKIGLIGFILGIVMLVMSLIAPSLGTYLVVYNEFQRVTLDDITPSISIVIGDHPDVINGPGDNLLNLKNMDGETVYWDELSVRINNGNNSIESYTNADDLTGAFSAGDTVVISEDIYDDPVTEATTLSITIVHERTNSLIYSGNIDIE